MPDSPAPSKFYTAMAALPTMAVQGPVNAAAIQRDANLVLEKATSLLAYQQYLTQARNWKGQAKALPAGFEREVKTQAAAALTDTRALASAALRMTSQFKQSGELDRMLSSWITAIQQSGPVQTADLVADLENQTSIRQTLQAEGVTDDIWGSLITNLKNFNAKLFVQDGKLAAEVKVPGQDKPRNVVLVPSATGMPQTLSDLLQRGSFERLTELFLQSGGANLRLLPGPPRDLELADVVLSGSILSVQSMAEHTRGLQDVGLAKYAGSAVVVIVVGALLVAGVIGYLVSQKYCKPDSSTAASAACIAADVLLILATFGLAVALGILGGANTNGPMLKCPGGLYYDSLNQEWVCNLNTRPTS